MQQNTGINGLIAGILQVLMLYSLNLQIMQHPKYF
ncbi:ABC transporter permease protein [Rickettsia canadensis str. CA410]|uniref:ABC transporter permease protein n=1 Tax=Rickettsia canadensis str. CA410 TaxID=1105107 RepID=A0ABM5MST6_RICCA|nr:ABC transporter permease protein [Rickettsia canadensis str. CA410]